MKKGAPEGIKHGKAVHPFEVVESIRDEHEYQGRPPREIYRRYAHIAQDTLRDWLYYRTRTRA